MFSDKTRSYLLAESKVDFLAKFNELQERKIQLPFGEVLFVRKDENVFALKNKCPHQGKPLEGCEIQDKHVVCPWHQYKFNLENGRGHGLYLETYKLEETQEGFYLLYTYFSWFGE